MLGVALFVLVWGVTALLFFVVFPAPRCKVCGSIWHWAEDHCPTHPDIVRDQTFGCPDCAIAADRKAAAERRRQEEEREDRLAAKIAERVAQSLRPPFDS